MKMKVFSLFAVSLFLFTLTSCAQKEPKVLTVYFSHWGGTKILAEMVHQAVGGDIYAIECVEPYPQEGTHAAAQKHIDAGVLPTLKGKVENLASYDVIFIGTPNWFSTMALPVKAFLTDNNLAGKTVVPFATFGGSVGEALNDIVKMCPQSTALEGFAVSGDDAKGKTEEVRTKVKEWAEKTMAVVKK